MKKNEITILLTGTGAPGAYGIIRCLRKNNERSIKIIGVDCNENAGCKNLVDKFYTVPWANDDNFIPAIINICKQNNVSVICPLVTRELAKFSRAKKMFKEDGILVCVSEEKILDIINNKINLLSYLQKSKVTTPRFKTVKSFDEFNSTLDDFDYKNVPVCIKPPIGNGSRGVHFIDSSISQYDLMFNNKANTMFTTKEALATALSEASVFPQLMIMEYLPGKEYSVDILAENGTVLYLVTRYSSVMNGGNAMVSRTINDARITNYIEKITKSLNLHGNIGFDLKENSDGLPLIMEINPRLTATVVLNAVAGVNFPYFGIKQILSEDLPEVNVIYNITMTRRYQEIFTNMETGVIIDF